MDDVLELDIDFNYLFAEALDRNPDGVAIFAVADEPIACRVVYVNEAFARMSGCTEEELVGHSALLLAGKYPDLEHVRAILYAASDAPMATTAHKHRPDGVAYDVDVRVDVVKDELGIVTHRILTQREREHVRSRAPSALASFATIASAVADAVDAPLSTISNALTETAEHADSHTRDAIARATRAAREIRDTTSEWRALRPESTKESEIDLHDALEIAVRITRSSTQRLARVVRRYGPLPAVLASRPALVHVFSTILRCAADAIPPFMPLANSITIVTHDDPDGAAVVEIADTGVGLDRDELASSVLGLGLAAAQSTIDRVGGSITVESVAGRGTRFRVRLPGLGRSALPPLPLFANDMPVRRVLVIADHPAVARKLGSMFEDDRSRVTIATPDDAVDMLSTDASFDLVICDAQDAREHRIRERLEAIAPETLMRTFELSAPAVETSMKSSGAFVRSTEAVMR